VTTVAETSEISHQRLTETEPEVFSAPDPDAIRQAKLWRAAWRWHFYAAAIVMPILLMLAVTGLGILLKPTLERTLYGEMLYVYPGGSARPLPYATQMAAVLARYPDATVRSVVPPRHANRSTQFDLGVPTGKTLSAYRDETLLSAYVDPYTGEVLGHVKGSTRLDNVLSDLHGSLLLGRWGDWVVELAGGWTLVMIATGLLLWWPRRAPGQKFRRAFRIRFGAGGRRRWRDLHSVPGAIFAGVIVFNIVTGLPWSQFWGDRWTRFTEWAGSGENAIDAPVSKAAAGDLQTDGLRVEWANQRKPVPLSELAQGHDHSGGGGGSGDGTGATPEPVSLDRVERIGREVGMVPGFAIGMPDGATGVYALSNSWPDRAQHARTAFVDQYSGKVLANNGWQDKGALSKATSFGIIAHMGRQYGPLNATVMGGACLAIIAAVVSAPVMFWKRRPKGTLGNPRRPLDPRIPRQALIVAMLLGVLYPMLGVSIVLVAAFDVLVVRNIGLLRRAFGMV
jgi:uncharacterized iron-regulated membrane protein